MTLELGAIGMVVADLDASLAFYRLLGLEPEVQGDHAEAPVGGFKVMWDTVEGVRAFNPSWSPASGGPAMSLAFQASSPAEVDDAVARLHDAGHRVEKEPWDAFWGQRYASVLDPDGNSVDVYAPL